MLAKPTVSLALHVQNVHEAGKTIHHEGCSRRNEQLSANTIYLSVEYHDAGKAHPNFQQAISTGKISEIRHETVSVAALFKDKLAWIYKHSDESDYLDELDDYVKGHSNAGKFTPPPEFRELVISAVAIAAHHSKLVHSNTPTIMKGLDKSYRSDARRAYALIDTVSDAIRSSKYNSIVEWSDAMNSARSFLRRADHLASRKETSVRIAETSKFSLRSFMPSSYTNIQKMVLELDNIPDVLFIRAAPGSGKTEAAFLFAEKCSAEKLIICLPTQATSTSMMYRMDKLFSGQVGIQFTNSITVCKEFKADAQYRYQVMTNNRTFYYGTNVCTIDQFISAYTNHNEIIRERSSNMLDACVIIDECDAYDDYVIENLIVAAALSIQRKIKMVIMSATMTTAWVAELQSRILTKHRQLFGEEGVGIKFESLYDKSRDSEICFDIHGFHGKCFNLKETLSKISFNSTAIVFMNTVRRAQEAYHFLREFYPYKEVILLHSRFTPSDKLVIEKKLAELFGRGARHEKDAPIAILTQVGEMSLDISCDMMVSDVAPLDRILQRTGRLCRFNRFAEKMPLHIIVPKILQDENTTDYAYPYVSLDGNALEIYTRTIRELSHRLGQRLSYAELLDIYESIYQTIAPSKDASRNSDLLIDLFRKNVVYNTNTTSKILDEETAEGWSCRKISNFSVSICPPPAEFKNEAEYNDFLFSNVVQLPAATPRIDNVVECVEFKKANATLAINVLKDKTLYTQTAGLEIKPNNSRKK